MAELLVQFDETVVGPDGTRYVARVWGDEDDIHRWVGWLEFAGMGQTAVHRTDHETVQPNRRDLEYWATGLTRVYLDGALVRALANSEAARAEPTVVESRPAFSGPAKSRHEQLVAEVRRRRGGRPSPS